MINYITLQKNPLESLVVKKFTSKIQVKLEFHCAKNKLILIIHLLPNFQNTRTSITRLVTDY